MPTEEQHAQLDLLVQGLVHFLDIAGNTQDIVARKVKLESIHLAFLRRARINAGGSVSFDRLRADTKTPPYAVSRAAAHLVKLEYGRVRDLMSDSRYRRFTINQKGREVIDFVDLEIAKMMLEDALIKTFDSKRGYLFTAHLHNLTRFLPDSRVTTDYFPADVDPAERINKEELEGQRIMTDFNANPRLTKVSTPRMTKVPSGRSVEPTR